MLPKASTLSIVCPIIKYGRGIILCVLAEYEIGVPPGRVGVYRAIINTALKTVTHSHKHDIRTPNVVIVL